MGQRVSAKEQPQPESIPLQFISLQFFLSVQFSLSSSFFVSRIARRARLWRATRSCAWGPRATHAVLYGVRPSARNAQLSTDTTINARREITSRFRSAPSGRTRRRSPAAFTKLFRNAARRSLLPFGVSHLHVPRGASPPNRYIDFDRHVIDPCLRERALRAEC